MKRLIRLLPAVTTLIALIAIPIPSVAAGLIHYVNGDNSSPPYTAPGTSCADPGYPTIQAAINNATALDTIEVCSGTYNENLVLNRDLTLNGAQAGMDACGRVAASNESTVTGSGLLLTLVAGSAGSTIDGFTFSGGTRAIESDSGPIDLLEIRNNRILGFTNSGIFLNDNGINITADQNLVDGTSKIGAGDLVHLDTDNFDGFHFTNNCVMNGATATGFFVDGNRNVDMLTPGSRLPLFMGNLIDRNLTGVNLGSRAWGDGPIAENTFSNNLSDGLQGGPRDTVISRNTFDGNGRSGLAFTSFGNTTDPARGAQRSTVIDNCFTGNGFINNGEAIFFSSTQFPTTISTNRANGNNIAGNRLGARYPGTETVDMTNNWWGAADGPGPPTGAGSGDGVDGETIVYTPFLPAPNPLTPACAARLPASGKVTGGGQINVPGGRGSFGFNAQLKDGDTSGHLNYMNHVTGAHLDCTVALFTELTPTTAKFEGPCSAQSGASSFMAEVEDNGEPGKDVDRFKITYNATTEGDLLRSGNIQIHVDPATSSSTSAQNTETSATGAGEGSMPAGATFNGISLNGLQVGMGLSIASGSAAAGQFFAVLQGMSPLGQAREIEVLGEVMSGSVASDGSVTFGGRATVAIGAGSAPLDLPFTVTATASGVLLRLGTSTLPSATLTGGSITIE